MLRNQRYFILEKDFENIQKEVKLGYIRKASHPKFPELSIYNYTDKCSFEEHWNESTKMCRGLVLNDKTLEVIIYCIPKFFNQHETFAAKVDFNNSSIFLKEDGYMIQYTYHDDYGLIVTSRGSFDSQYANYVYEFLKDKVKTTSQSKERLSYMLELCKDFPGDENIIVTRHPKERFVCWAATNACGSEVQDLSSIKDFLPEGIEIVKSFSPEEAEKYLKEEVEGVVLRNFEYPNERVKIKTSWFLEMHKLISSCTKKRVWELVRDNQLVSSLEGIPDEFMQQMLEWEDEINERIDQISKKAFDYAKEYESWSDKDLGIKKPIDGFYLALVFNIRKKQEKKYSDSILRYVGKTLGE